MEQTGWQRLSLRLMCIWLLFELAIHPLGAAKWWSNDPLSVHSMRNDRVQIMQLYQGPNKLRLRCDAKGTNASESLVLLGCPSVQTGVCMENCMSPCLILEGSPDCTNRTLDPIEYCLYRKMSTDHVRVDYIVQLTGEQDAGQWWCMFRGQSSDPVAIKYQPVKITPEINRTQDIVPVTSSSISNLSISILTTQQIYANPSPNATEEQNMPLYSVVNMPVEVLVCIIVFVCISIIFNVAFFVRCCAVNRYLKKLHKGDPRIHWYDHLLCVEKSKALKNHSGLNYIRIPEHKPSPLIFTPNPVLRPNSPLFFHNIMQASSTGNTPLLVQSVTPPTGQYEAQPGLDLIYDDVNHSTYTTVNPAGKMQLSNSLMPMVSTPDGKTWILDQTRRVYLPCGQTVYPMSYQGTQIPGTLPYEYNSRILGRVPENEQDAMFCGARSQSTIYTGKRCVTPLPISPSGNTMQRQIPRAGSTPPFAYSNSGTISATNLAGSATAKVPIFGREQSGPAI